MQARVHAQHCAQYSALRTQQKVRLRTRRCKALSDRQSVKAAVSTTAVTTTAAAAASPNPEGIHAAPQADVDVQQPGKELGGAALLQKLRREAYEAGFKAGYQKGVQVQVTVSVDLDDDSGSYLRRQQNSRPTSSRGTGTGPSSSSSNSRSSSGSPNQQPWLPQSRSTGTHGQTAAADSALASQGSKPADSVIRSAVKGLVWRIFSTTATVSVALLIMQDSLQVSDAIKFGGIEFATKYVLYFLHERLWAAIVL